MKTIKIKDYNIYADVIGKINVKNHLTVINTINAHSYIVARKDELFRRSLKESDVLLPDGEGIVLMAKVLKNQEIRKIAGAEIHEHLLVEAQKKGLKCFYLGASKETLERIDRKLSKTYNNIEFYFFSPPFKTNFSNEDNNTIINAINEANPDILFVGMTAPKQEKWVHENKKAINVKLICSIGAVFDFVAETTKRAPHWMIKLRMEWLYRSFTSVRLFKRYIYSTPLFLWEVYKLKFSRN